MLLTLDAALSNRNSTLDSVSVYTQTSAVCWCHWIIYILYIFSSFYCRRSRAHYNKERTTNKQKKRKVEMFCFVFASFFLIFFFSFTSIFSVVQRYCWCGCGFAFNSFDYICAPAPRHTQRDFNDEWHREKVEWKRQDEKERAQYFTLYLNWLRKWKRPYNKIENSSMVCECLWRGETSYLSSRHFASVLRRMQCGVAGICSWNVSACSFFSHLAFNISSYAKRYAVWYIV